MNSFRNTNASIQRKYMLTVNNCFLAKHLKGVSILNLWPISQHQLSLNANVHTSPGNGGGRGQLNSALKCYYSESSLISTDIPSPLGQVIKALLYWEPQIQHKGCGLWRKAWHGGRAACSQSWKGAGEGEVLVRPERGTKVCAARRRRKHRSSDVASLPLQGRGEASRGALSWRTVA